MKRQHKVHTIDNILERTEEYGDCRIWTGYSIRKTPQVDVNGKMTGVRRVIARLQGKEEKPGHFFGVSCGTYLCVCPDHIIQRSRRQQSVHMARAANAGAANVVRKAKITAKKRANAKIDMATAQEIRAKSGTYREIAKEYGVSHGLVGHIKRGRYWKDSANPFAGLMV